MMRELRTYSRKRPVYHAISDIDQLCRLCLKKSDEKVSIFGEAASFRSSLSMRIMLCVGLEIVQEKDLPETICSECFTQIEKTYAFRKMCEVSYLKLKSHINAIKFMEAEKAVSELKASLENDNSKNINEKNNGFNVYTNGDCDKMGEPHLYLIFDEINEVHVPDEAVAATVSHLGSNLVKMEVSSNQNNPSEEVEVVSTNNVINEIKNLEMEESPNQNNPSEELEVVSNNNDKNEINNLEENQLVTEESDLKTLLTNALVASGMLQIKDGVLSICDVDPILKLVTSDGLELLMSVQEEDDLTHIEETPQINNVFNKTECYQVNRDDKMDNPKRHMCSVCLTHYVSRSALRRHERTHTSERPHKCPECGQGFAQKSDMERHRLVHRETRPHACPQCPKTYTQRNALLAHLSTHEDMRHLALHACAVCPAVFLHASGLSRHVRSAHKRHTFSCDECKKTFSDKSSLLRHLNSLQRTCGQRAKPRAKSKLVTSKPKPQ